MQGVASIYQKSSKYLGIKDNESMKIFNELLLKFEKPDWSANPEFCVIDTILESRPDIILMLKSDIIGNERASTFGRQDTPSVEQIVRAAIFKEMRECITGNWNIHKTIPGYVELL